MFVLIEASKLSMDDEFMQYQPKTKNEKEFKDLLEDVIKKGIADFWRPRMDPTLDEAENICFKARKRPAIGKSYNWWRDNAKKFNPKRKSRLGTKSEYVAFLGVLLKNLVADGWEVVTAWNAVCKDSKSLGHYWNSVEVLHDFEHTGSREIGGFYDLANTYKILAEDEDACGFWLAGGNCKDVIDYSPLADFIHDFSRYGENAVSVGWLVLEA